MHSLACHYFHLLTASLHSGFLTTLIAFGALQLLSILVHAKLSTHQYKNVGTIRVVPIRGYDEEMVEVAAPAPVQQASSRD